MRCSLIYVLPLLVTTGVFAAPTHDEGGEFSVRDHRDALEERGMDGMDHFEERDHLIDLDERDELDLDERGEFSVADHRAALEKRGVVAFDLDARGFAEAELEARGNAELDEVDDDEATHQYVRRANLPGASITANSNPNTIKSLQWQLVARGYHITVDGAFGPKTKAAVVAFQRSQRLAADGQPGPATLGALVVNVKRGSTGNAAKAAQTALNAFGYNLAVDGNFGAASHNAAVRFQRSKGLTADGIIGPLTWAKLYGGGGSTGPDPHPRGSCDAVKASVPISATTIVGPFRVHKCLAPKLTAMLAAARKDGVNLTPNSSYRSIESQIALRKQNCGGDVWKKPSSQCRPPTAIPGTSRHERGLAIDFANCQRGTRSFNWLVRNAGRFHFINYKPETWHWSYDGN